MRPLLERCRVAAALLGLTAVVTGGCRAPTPPAASTEPPTAPPATVTAAAATPPAARAAPIAPAVLSEGAPGTVRRVIDGDTLVVDVAGSEETIRLIGIDTPESRRPGTPVECYALEASARLEELTPPGSVVHLVRDVELRDDYDRLLAYVVTAAGVFVNLALVEDGFARPLEIEPNVTFSAEVRAAGAAARSDRVGLWGACPG